MMLDSTECISQGTVADGTGNAVTEDPAAKFWFPALFSFYDIIMNGEDLEVRQM